MYSIKGEIMSTDAKREENRRYLAGQDDIKTRVPKGHRDEYIANLIFGIEKTDIEEIEPDEWDLKMIEEARANNDFSGIV